jgi:hypothetical protein
MTQITHKEWRQFAEARSLDPVTGKKYPPRLGAQEPVHAPIRRIGADGCLTSRIWFYGPFQDGGGSVSPCKETIGYF